MAVRFDNSANQLTRTANLPDDIAFTACGWAQLVTDTNNFANIFSLESGSSSASSGIYLQTDSDGTSLLLGCAGPGFFETAAVATLAAGTSFFWAVSSTGALSNQKTARFRTNAQAVLSSVSPTGTGSATFTPAALFLGQDSFNELWNGRLWNVKVWDRALSAAELLVESYYRRPQFPASLNLWLPLHSSADVNDYSGNARNPTVGGTLTTEDGSHGLWRPRRRVFVPVGATGISGAAAITLDALTASAAGTVALAGTAAITLGALTASSAGAVALAGTASITLGAATLASTGALALAGAVDATLAPATLAAAGALGIAGTASVTLEALTSSAAGVVAQAGTASITLDALTSSAAGAVALTGVADITLGALVLDATGASDAGVVGEADITLEAATLASAGALALAGAAALTLEAATLAATGVLALTGAADITLGALTLDAAGASGERTGSADITLEGLTVSGAGGVPQSLGGGGLASRDIAEQARRNRAAVAARIGRLVPEVRQATPPAPRYVPPRPPTTAEVQTAEHRAARRIARQMRIEQLQAQLHAEAVDHALGRVELEAMRAELTQALADEWQAQMDALAIVLLTAAVQ